MTFGRCKALRRVPRVVADDGQVIECSCIEILSSVTPTMAGEKNRMVMAGPMRTIELRATWDRVFWAASLTGPP